MLNPTRRHLRRGEAEPGVYVEYLGETSSAMLDGPEDPARLIYAGHPGRIDRDWEAPLGGHVVVTWHGLEDTDESTESSGYGWSAEDETYPGLGLIDQQIYEARVARLDNGVPPIE